MTKPVGDYFFDPPERIDTSFDDVTHEPMWPYDDGVVLGFASDEECSLLSGVPERSLRTLQTAGVIKATRVPIGHGTHRRMWHLPEAVVALTVENLRRATNWDYPNLGRVSQHIAQEVRSSFFIYVFNKKQTYDWKIILADNSAFFANDRPIAEIEDSKSKAVKASDRMRLLALLENSRIQVIVNLKNVFWEFENRARLMRR